MNVLLLCLIVAVYSGWVGWHLAMLTVEKQRHIVLEQRLRAQVDGQRARDVLALADDVDREASS